LFDVEEALLLFRLVPDYFFRRQVSYFDFSLGCVEYRSPSPRLSNAAKWEIFSFGSY
jgi:hypothetical protein